MGGFVGNISAGLTVDNCAVRIDAQVPSTVEDVSVGGMVGYTTGDVMLSDSYVTGSIDMLPQIFGGAHGCAGGMVGNQRYSQLLTVDRCWTDVDISDADVMGVLVGYSDTLFAGVSACWAEGTLSLADAVALLTAESETVASCMGGIVGYNTNTNGVTGYGSSLIVQDCCFVGSIVCAENLMARCFFCVCICYRVPCVHGTADHQRGDQQHGYGNA